MRYLIVLVFFLVLTASFASEDKVFSFSFGPVSIGEARVPISVDDFEVLVKSSENRISTAIESESVQWVRGEHDILSPRARVLITVKGDASLLHLEYQGRDILLQRKNSSEAQTILYISLFYPESIRVLEKDQKIGEILLRPKKTQRLSQKKSKLIDYSCSPYSLIIEGLDQDYLSVSCRLARMGNFGSEKPLLEVNWTATNVHLADGSAPPYVAMITDSSPVVTKVKTGSGEEEQITIQAKLPERLYRLRTALGVGPYSLTSQEDELEHKAPMAPAGMLYANLMLTEGSSLRAFDAVVSQKSLFNNAGLYFAYDLGSAFDQRVMVTALLGLQSLTYRYSSAYKTRTNLIYPQGVEVVLKHFWGIENYHLIYGMFISPSSNEDYKNLWLRYGTRVFGEINYISWSDGRRSASMWGLSIGFPFISFF